MSVPTEAQVEAAAKALREEAEGFSYPVRFYVENEARERWSKAHPDEDEWAHYKDWALESWKILARAALTAGCT